MSMKIQLLVFLIGSLSLCVLAEEGTPLTEEETATADIGDGTASEFPEDSTQELTTTDSVLSTRGDAENSTDSSIPGISDDGLETATLAGIIIGIIVAIGVATGIILAIVKKVSGRYSP
nr:podoplanin isoform X1 [Pogona vitticeps]